MGRFNVYVGDELEARMAAHRENLNWSNLAQAAFERAINLEELKGQNVEQASIERLRQSRSESEDRRSAEGQAAGKEWAANVAEFDELQRVASLGAGDLGAEADDAAFALAQAWLDDGSPNQNDVCEAMREIFGRMRPTYAEVEGFIAGATEVYDQV